MTSHTIRLDRTLLPMPLWSEHADCFVESRLAPEIFRLVRRIRGIGVDPVRMVPTVVRAVKLVIRIDPTAQDHQLIGIEHLGVVVPGIPGMT